MFGKTALDNSKKGIVKKLLSLKEQKFDFQGSQILHIRVAISLADVEIGLEKNCQKMGNILT